MEAQFDAASAYAEPAQGPIPAYAKLEFPGFSYYIQTLNVTIGRRPVASSSAAPIADIPEQQFLHTTSGDDVPVPAFTAPPDGHVDVDLGPLKSISRLHARIFYLAPGQPLIPSTAPDVDEDLIEAVQSLASSQQTGFDTATNPTAQAPAGTTTSSSSSSNSIPALASFPQRNGISIGPMSPSLSHPGVNGSIGSGGWDSAAGLLHATRGGLPIVNWSDQQDQQQVGRFILHVLGRNGAFVDDVWAEKDCCIALGKRTKIQIAERVFYFVLPRDVQDDEDDVATQFSGPSSHNLLLDPFFTKDSDADSSDSDEETSDSDLSEISGSADLDSSDEEDDSEQENDASDESEEGSDDDEDLSDGSSQAGHETDDGSDNDFVELPPPPPLSSRLPSGGSKVSSSTIGKGKGKGGDYARKNPANPPPMPKLNKGKAKATSAPNGSASTSTLNSPKSAAKNAAAAAASPSQNKIPAWMYAGIAGRKRKRGEAGSDDEPMKVGTPIGIEALEAAQRRAKANKSASSKAPAAEVPTGPAHQAQLHSTELVTGSSAPAATDPLPSTSTAAPLAKVEAKPAAAQPQSAPALPPAAPIVKAPVVPITAAPAPRQSSTKQEAIPTKLPPTHSIQPPPSLPPKPAAQALPPTTRPAGALATSSAAGSNSAVPSTSTPPRVAPASSVPPALPVKAPLPPTTPAQRPLAGAAPTPATSAAITTTTAAASAPTATPNTPIRPTTGAPPTPRRIPIVVGDIPAAALPPPGSKPKPVPGSVEALLESPPIVHHEGKLYLSPPVFGHLGAVELERIESMGAQAALKVLQGYLVDHLKEKIRLQNAAKNAQAQAQRAAAAAAAGGPHAASTGGAGPGPRSAATAPVAARPNGAIPNTVGRGAITTPAALPRPAGVPPGVGVPRPTAPVRPLAVGTSPAGARPATSQVQQPLRTTPTTTAGAAAAPGVARPTAVPAGAPTSMTLPSGPSSSRTAVSPSTPDADPLAALDALAAHPEAAVLIQLLKQQRAEGGGINQLTPEQMELLQMANKLAAQQASKSKKKKKKKSKEGGPSPVPGSAGEASGSGTSMSTQQPAAPLPPTTSPAIAGGPQSNTVVVPTTPAMPPPPRPSPTQPPPPTNVQPASS
ncbi:Pre-rRNA-processing protein fhl1 [Tilletia horrida]|nr:Pre-rRNA-processing protein fhl1 [Tilletia horrida]